MAATWAIIVYVAGLLATKGPDWVDPIKIAAGRTVAAMNRLQVTPMVEALMDGGAIPYLTPTRSEEHQIKCLI